MTVVESLQGLGSWELHLQETTPDYIVTQLNWFGHMVIVDGHLPVGYVESAGNSLLPGARYVGVCREQDHPADYVRGGVGLITWLGDEDGKGNNFESTVNLTGATLAQVVAALKPPAVTTGTVYPQADPAARYSGPHIFQSPREALTIALAAFGAEVRVNPDFSIDVGTPSQLYNTATPDKIIKRRAVGADVDLAAVGGSVDVKGTARDYSTRIVLLGQTLGTGGAPDTMFATGSISAPSVPYKDPQGNPLVLTRFISESGQTTGSVAARAQLQLNRFNRTQSSVKVTADQFEVQGSFSVGDAVYVYDPDSGIVNAGIEVLFRGEKLNPDIVRVTQREWPIVDGMTVAWRTDAGVWIDLTPWVVWETAGQHELTVGDMPKTLFKQGTPNGAVQDRIDAGRGVPDSTRTPKAPTGLALTTSSSPNASGWDAAVISASWNPVTQYTDGTSVALDHYEVQYRPQFRSPQWTASYVTTDVGADLPVTAALGYDVQVRAVSTGGVASAWSTSASIISAADSTGPAAPSDPVVTSYLGLLRIYWNGLNNVGGAMPADFNRVDVHVGTTSAFTASAATLVSSLSAPGYAHVQAPYGSTRWVRFIAYDHNGNPSAASGTISGATVQAADGDIAALNVGKLVSGTGTFDLVMAGRVTTALTGARREMNSVGFQAFDASNTLLINLDGVNNLLTGILKTALTGRRIEVGAGGGLGQINFYAPDGSQGRILSFTSGTGIEAIQMAMPITGASSAWNAFQVDNSENSYVISKTVNFLFGGAASTGSFTVGFLADKSNTTTGATTLFQITPTLTNLVGNSTNVTFSTSGAFTAYEQPATGSAVPRLNLAGGGASTIYYSQGATFDVVQRLSTSALIYRVHIDDIDAYFQYVNHAGRVVLRAPSGSLSAKVQMINDASYGAVIRAFVNSDGTGSRVDITDANESFYIPVWASAFTVSSTQDHKADIRPLDGDGVMGELRALKVHTYRRRLPKKAPLPPVRPLLPVTAPPPAPPEEPDRFGDLEVGLIAEHSPTVATPDGKAVDLYQLICKVLVGVQGIDGRLTALEGAACEPAG